MINLPGNLFYSETHEWVQLEPDNIVSVGITDFAQQALGKVTYIELPGVGQQLARGDACAVLESAKVVCDVRSPVTGEVVSVNELLAADCTALNGEPYLAWLIRIRAAAIAETATLLDAGAYRALLAEAA